MEYAYQLPIIFKPSIYYELYLPHPPYEDHIFGLIAFPFSAYLMIWVLRLLYYMIGAKMGAYLETDEAGSGICLSYLHFRIKIPYLHNHMQTQPYLLLFWL